MIYSTKNSMEQPGIWDEVLTVSLPSGEGGSESGAENLLLFLQNHQSSVVGTLETSNPLVSRQLFTYLAYGEPKGTSPESLPLSGIGYTGRQHDDTGLMYYRGRYRDSCTGTFIQEDKMRDGWNWYGYASDPVNNTDPSGYFNFDTLNISDLVTGTKRFGQSMISWESLAFMGGGAAAAIAFPATIPAMAGVGAVLSVYQLGAAAMNDNNIEAVEQLLGGTIGLAGAGLAKSAYKPKPSSWIGKGVENDEAWSKLGLWEKLDYEFGQKTLVNYKKTEGIDTVQDIVDRGNDLRKQGLFKALKLEDPTLGLWTGTFNTGPTPLGRAAARVTGSAATAVTASKAFHFKDFFQRICE